MSWLFLAYLDPSAGSMMLQIILGGVAGLMIALKLFWAKILLGLGIGRKKSEAEEAEPEADPETRGGA
ncbi:MAG TPA: hypothetical protein VNW71_01280 [Thermoanaerobaculia bacterium]|nr:hypothetical protein [Thermoanaerobaculia bacterium]